MGDGWRRAFMGLAGVVVLALVAAVAFHVGEGHGNGVAEGARGEWGPHAGFGFFFFPLLFFPLGFFLVLAFMRALFWGFGGPGWHGGHHGGREERLEEWHRRLHEHEQASRAPSSDQPRE